MSDVGLFLIIFGFLFIIVAVFIALGLLVVNVLDRLVEQDK